MEHWNGVLRVPLDLKHKNYYRVAASLCFSCASRMLIVPSANVIFFNGDRVQGTGNPVIERLSDLQIIADVLVSKFGGSVNAWVIEASVFNGPFAVYNDFVPSVNRWGEPKSYSAVGFPASTSTISLLSNFLEEAKNIMPVHKKEPCLTGASASYFCQPTTLILGFSKGGTVVNQIVTECSLLGVKSPEHQSPLKEQQVGSEFTKITEESQIIPRTKESFLDSIKEIHYVDVGLNLCGAYITDPNVIENISKRCAQGDKSIRFVLHGTPRQWCDSRRDWIREEKDKLVHLLNSRAWKSNGNLQVCERFYFADSPPDVQMHFEIIEKMDVS
ncbi:uncharacterized protein LOC110807638 [Carica papaya]|uniref:uncharacterized protein LOC110807638 n=1 Tax=Carica papaya TaxID=3649 RepID=UPI000B8CF3A2|nr:uncharacterized protein LOC110807638 [Carica papaya]XP_021888504.1 uncharacterized protein LOC110807638 [Carica papaya]XP_021888505.1 uncharacterized protein LOC110807638 [Carica papaya]